MMRKTVLLTGISLLFGGANAFAAIDCATLPSCTDLGYTKSKSDCYKYTVCPFDTSKVACAEAPHIGDIKYSLYSANHDGWLLCNGSQYSQTSYSKLYNVIKTNFCSVRSGGCSSGYFAVPDYRGFFLRGYSYPSSTTSYSTYSGSWNYSTTSPQKQQLPNISAYWYSSYEDQNRGGYQCGGAVSCSYTSSYALEIPKDAGSGGIYRSFNASNSNSIYSGSHVVPANYGTYIFIYAGQ